MDKRYQVFVSSTYSDLKDERKLVTQSLLEMDCIPQGMELFPAADEEQWAFIKKVIDDCDYYILIIGGRYGSTTPEGISYTEKEYDYAIDKGIPVLSFVHENPGGIPFDKSETDPEARQHLDAFRAKVLTGKLVKMWSDAKLLPALVVTSLNRTIKSHPAVGWVRADKLPSEQLLTEINELRKKNEELVRQTSSSPKIKDIAGLDESVVISGKKKSLSMDQEWKFTTTWGHIFSMLSPYLLTNPSDETVRSYINKYAKEFLKIEEDYITVNVHDWVYQTIKVQFMALNLVNVVYAQSVGGSYFLYWNITTQGKEQMLTLRAVKTTINKKTPK